MLRKRTKIGAVCGLLAIVVAIVAIIRKRSKSN